MADVTTALVGGITSVGTEALDAIGKVIPVALPVMGAIVVVSVGIKAFKKVTGR